MKVLKTLITPNLKEKQVKSLAETLKKAKTLMVVSLENLPSKQFQDIKKIIREHADIKVAKKNILLRTLKELKKESILPLQEYIKDNSAFAISKLEGFELAGILSKNKTPMFAKAGQIAPENIEIKEGPTTLVPGPAISELGALGIQIAVEEGKISIKKSKIIVKKDQIIKSEVASLLQKLDIQPMTIGLKPIAVYDIESEKIFADININAEETKNLLINASGKALGFAQKIVYVCKETIGYLLAKADMQGKALAKFYPMEETKEKKGESKDEEKSVDEVKVEKESNEEKVEEGSKDEEKIDEVKVENIKDKEEKPSVKIKETKEEKKNE